MLPLLLKLLVENVNEVNQTFLTKADLGLLLRALVHLDLDLLRQLVLVLKEHAKRLDQALLMRDSLVLLRVVFSDLLVLRTDVLGATLLLKQHILMRLNLVGHRDDFLLHLVDLLVQLLDVGQVLGTHGLFSFACLPHDQILLLNVLEFLRLGLLLDQGLLSATLLDLGPLSLHYFDLIEGYFKFLVQRVHMQEVLIRRQLFLALLYAFLDNLLLLPQVFDFFQPLVLDPEELLLTLLYLLLKAFLFLPQLRCLLHSFHGLSLSVELDIL